MKSKVKTKASNRSKLIGGQKACDPGAKPLHRSIPVAEVNSMIQREVNRVKSQLTIYDDRLAVLAELEMNESELEYLNACVHDTQIRNKQLRSDLARVNLAIKRQMELDGQ